MKRLLIYSCSLLLIFALIIAPAAAGCEELPQLRAFAMSDLHVDEFLTNKNNDKQLTNMLTFAAQGTYDALICGGDISSYGNSDKWYAVQDQIERLTNIPEELWVLGNHEYGTTGLFATPAQVQANFRAFTGYTGVYYHSVLNGYHFIVLAVEQALPAGVLGSEQVNWFAAQLASAAEDSNGKPIFVISHYDMGSGTMSANFSGLLAQYDNVFFLYGHIHNNAPTSLDEAVSTSEGYTSARMGSLNYYDAEETADCLLITVYTSKVVLEVVRTEGPPLSPSRQTIPLTGTIEYSADWANGYATVFAVLPEEYVGKTVVAAVYNSTGRLVGVGLCDRAEAIISMRIYCSQASASSWSIFILGDGASPLQVKHSGTFG